MNSDQLLQEAFAHLADRAPDPDRVRAALPARARRTTRRRRTYRAGLAAAVVVLAVGAVSIGPRVLLGHPIARPGHSAQTTSRPGPSPSPSRHVTGPGLPLRYAPTWLPEGLRERERDAANQHSSDVGRVWLPASSPVRGGWRPNAPRLDFGVTSGTFHGCMSGHVGEPGTMVQVGDAPGCISSGSMRQLAWQLAPNTIGLLTPSNLGWDINTLLRVAASVRPDPTLLPIPLRPGSLPADRAVAAVIAEGNSATDWRYQVRTTSTRPGATTAQSLDVSIGTWTEAVAGGQQLTVTIGRVARPARLASQKLNDGGWVNYLVVQLDNGQLLTVTVAGAVDAGSDPGARDQMVRIAEGIQIDEQALDVSWLSR